MSIILLLGLLIAFLLPLGLAVLLTSLVTLFARRLRKNVYVSFLNIAISNWIAFAILLVFVFPEAGLSLTSIGFKAGISEIDAFHDGLTSHFMVPTSRSKLRTP